MKKVYIMRGLTGSGKTTKAIELAGEAGTIHSTDDYFVVDGKYTFDASKISENHRRNLKSFTESLNQEIPVVVCDNTNSKRWEFQPYIKAATAMGYEIEVISIPHPTIDVCLSRTTHKNIPREVVVRMYERWEY